MTFFVLKCTKCGLPISPFKGREVDCIRGGLCEYESVIDDAKKSKKKDRIPTTGYVYLFKADKIYKIGCTTNIDERIKGLSTGSIHNIICVHKFKTTDMFRDEKFIQKLYKDKQLKGEWFELSENDVKEIKKVSNNRQLNELKDKKDREHRINTDIKIRDSIWGAFGVNGRDMTPEERDMENKV